MSQTHHHKDLILQKQDRQDKVFSGPQSWQNTKPGSCPPQPASETSLPAGSRATSVRLGLSVTKDRWETAPRSWSQTGLNCGAMHNPGKCLRPCPHLLNYPLVTAALWVPSFMKGPGSKPGSTSSSRAQPRKPLVEPWCDRGSGNSNSGREYASVGFRSIKQDSWLPREEEKQKVKYSDSEVGHPGLKH